MGEWRNAAIKAGLETLFFTGAHVMARPFLGGLGAILTLHRVKPIRHGKFQPNNLLEVAPEFLEETLSRIRRAGIDIVDLDEAVERLKVSHRSRRFVVITFDDGYTDNYTAAWHVLRRMKAPFTIYIPSAFPDGKGRLWWIAIERLIAAQSAVVVEIGEDRRLFETAYPMAKRQAYNAIHAWLRALNSAEQESAIVCLCERYGIDLDALCRELIMSWDQIAEMAASPHVTIGAHTVNHFAISNLGESQARYEMRESANVIQAVIGKRPKHFSFPYGWEEAAGARDFALAREEGYSTAVTTRPGVLFPEHADYLTALPRLSLNGRFQSQRYLDVLLSGLPTYVFNRFARCNVA